MTAVPRNVYIKKLTEVVCKNSNIYHRTIRIKPVDNKSEMNIEYSVKHNDKDTNFKVGDYVRISKYKKNCERVHSRLA